MTRGGSTVIAVAGAFAAVTGWCACSSTAASPAPDAGAIAPSDSDASPDTRPIDASQDATVDEDAPSEGGDAGARTYTPECIAHCNVIVTGCAAEGYPQFGTMSACLNACAMYPVGSPDDWSTQADTLMCREHHTSSAVMNGGYHCFHGGPYGYGSCGHMCDGLCRIAMVWCGASAGGAPFPSLQTCMTECLAWPWAPQGPDGLAAYRPSSPTSGNTLECREVMLVKSLESESNRDTYCPLAATNSATCK